MNSAKLYIISESSYYATHWYTQTMDGVFSCASENGLEVIGLEAEEFDTLMKEKPVLPKGSPVLLLGTSTGWIQQIITKLSALQIRTIVLGSQISGMFRRTSFITLNHYATVFDMVGYLAQCGCNKTALIGINEMSITDVLKSNGYLDGMTAYGLPSGNNNIFYNHGALEECIEAFLEKRDTYNAVLCSNDLVAVLLIKALKKAECKIPESLMVAGFGDTLLGQLVEPSLTTATLNYYEVGRHSVELFLYLDKFSSIESISITVSCKIIPRSSSGYHQLQTPLLNGNITSEDDIGQNLFYSDPKVIRFLNLEEMFQNMDHRDYQILCGIYKGETYEALAEHLDISNGTVKYRLKKMMKTLNISSKQELLDYIGNELGREAFTTMGKW